MSHEFGTCFPRVSTGSVCFLTRLFRGGSLVFRMEKLGMGMGIRQQFYDLTAHALSLRHRHCKEDETLLLNSSHPVKVGCTLKIVDYGFPF